MLHGLDDRAASIYAPVRSELHQVEQKLLSLADTEAAHLRPLLDYVTDSGESGSGRPSRFWPPISTPTTRKNRC